MLVERRRRAAPDLTSPDFTVRSVPGQTMDLIYEWTGKGIGWDIYGTTAINPHTCTPDANGYHSVATDKNYREWCADHNKPIPVTVRRAARPLVRRELQRQPVPRHDGQPAAGAPGAEHDRRLLPYVALPQ